jgi:hypothetical protein
VSTEGTEQTVKHRGAEKRSENGEDHRLFFSVRLRFSVSLRYTVSSVFSVAPRLLRCTASSPLHRLLRCTPLERECGERRPSSLHDEFLLQKVLSNAIAQVSLELDRVFRHRPAGTTRAFELLTQFP